MNVLITACHLEVSKRHKVRCFTQPPATRASVDSRQRDLMNRCLMSIKKKFFSYLIVFFFYTILYILYETCIKPVEGVLHLKLLFIPQFTV